MKCWQVTVEDNHGIIAVHYVLAVWSESAQTQEEENGYRVLSVIQHNRPNSERR